jgi:hypothetical protein
VGAFGGDLVAILCCVHLQQHLSKSFILFSARGLYYSTYITDYNVSILSMASFDETSVGRKMV